MLDAEAEPVSREEMQQLMTQHRRLLWDSIPRALMPNFRVVDRSLVETSVSVGKYRFVRKMETVQGTVLQAMDEKSQSVAIKVIDKSTVFTPGELEGIYRECRFLSDMLQHPNVARCIDMLHSQSRVYLVFDYAGDQNLAQVLEALPGRRLDCAVALHVFDGLASGLAHCHTKEVTHRAVSLEHVVLLAQPGRRELFRVTLVDFHSAMVARGETTSRTQCGALPCIAPEVAMGGAYVPWRADCWSAGIVLLEAAGGVSTLCQCAPYQTGVELIEAAPAIQNYFAQPGAHERALAFAGGVQHEAVQQRLEALLQVQPASRARVADLISPEYADRVEEMLAQQAQAQAGAQPQPQPPPQPPVPQG